MTRFGVLLGLLCALPYAAAALVAVQDPSPAAGAAAGGGWYPARVACPGDVPVRATRRSLTFHSAGHDVSGIAYAPTGEANGAAIVILPGAGGLGATLTTFDARGLQLASRGYHVMQVQYYDATAGRTERSERSMQRWSDVAEDAAALLAAMPGVDEGRIGVWGYSLGGWLAVEGALRKDSARAAIGVAAGTDVAPSGHARRRLPVLLIHARHDPMISLRSNADWASSLRSRGASIETEVLESQEHIFDQPTWCAVFESSVTFLNHTLLAPKA